MVLKFIKSSKEFLTEVDQSDDKLVVFANSKPTCKECVSFAPFCIVLNKKFPKVLFVIVEVEKCAHLGSDEKDDEKDEKSSSPTAAFNLYFKRTQVDWLPVESFSRLPEKIAHWENIILSSIDTPVPGQQDLRNTIAVNDCECLNESDENNLEKFFSSNGSKPLVSDVNDQLMINIAFLQPVKLHSIKIKGPANYAPRTIKIFKNQAPTPSFEQATRGQPVQTLILSDKQVTEGLIVGLNYVKFQDVNNVVFFIVDNIGKAKQTQITDMKFFGTPRNMTNSRIVRVTGNVGEIDSPN